MTNPKIYFFLFNFASVNLSHKVIFKEMLSFFYLALASNNKLLFAPNMPLACPIQEQNNTCLQDT